MSMPARVIGVPRGAPRSIPDNQPNPEAAGPAMLGRTPDTVVNAALGESLDQGDGSLRPLSTRASWVVLGWLLVVAATTGLACVTLLSALEQVEQVARQTASTTVTAEPPILPDLNVLGIHITFTADAGVLLLAILWGMLGSLVHALTELAQSRGTRQSKRGGPRYHGAVWFVAAPFQGGLLASLVIAAVAAGLLSTGQSTSSTGVSLFTVSSVAGVTGLFSKRMTDKLAELINRVTDTGAKKPPR
ncbi:hypothetical protein [Arthrobacter sp. efr-133-TYG-118]|uniref:hypothetical protein n=1 Tax=Arthrobacter sp. efr-133-TYG-118 TaxID=3040279 RepID=UPI002551256E|nr:hypothetical protein [Arthrobacter sp. efr-133-TYG-118]